MIPLHTRQECGAIAKLLSDMRSNPTALEDSKSNLITILSDIRARLDDKWLQPATEMFAESDDENLAREVIIPAMMQSLDGQGSSTLLVPQEGTLEDFTDEVRDLSICTDNSQLRRVCDAWLGHWNLLHLGT
jgi:hypothetical protein